MNKTVHMIFKFGKLVIWRTFLVGVPIHPNLRYLSCMYRSTSELFLVYWDEWHMLSSCSTTTKQINKIYKILYWFYWKCLTSLLLLQDFFFVPQLQAPVHDTSSALHLHLLVEQVELHSHATTLIFLPLFLISDSIISSLETSIDETFIDDDVSIVVRN